MPVFTPIKYSELNARQQENFNFQKVSSQLADFGYSTMRLTDDWQGADFIAQHVDGLTVLRVQLKGRMTVAKKYERKDLHIAFPINGNWYLANHDELLEILLDSTKLASTKSWRDDGTYSFPRPGKDLITLISKFRI